MWLITKARLRSMGRRVVTSDEYLHDIALDGKLIRESGITFDYFFGYFILFHFVLCCVVRAQRLTVDLAEDR